ncbi:hypothetical protein TorRG33x02_175730 [Trema orientale]|uniref:Uncharacterized protein n=1 Tax=Trema orientale TaxID=63057 RepID=A0A2P5EM40_TREOI|nr:hypothetical protein TorRG33x02_175730 [Trema orientale]
MAHRIINPLHDVIQRLQRKVIHKFVPLGVKYVEASQKYNAYYQRIRGLGDFLDSPNLYEGVIYFSIPRKKD